jgi:hypothetical protein
MAAVIGFSEPLNYVQFWSVLLRKHYASENTKLRSMLELRQNLTDYGWILQTTAIS